MAIGESAREFVVSYSEEECVRRLSLALSALGQVEEVSNGTRTIVGTMKYGLQKVRLRISYEPTSDGTRVRIWGAGDDVWGAASRSTADRLITGLDKVDEPNWQPDKLGMSQGNLAIMVVAFVLILIVLLPILIKAAGI